jgi:hypothetical protein
MNPKVIKSAADLPVGPMPRLAAMARESIEALKNTNVDVSDVLAIIRLESMGLAWNCGTCGQTRKQQETIAELTGVTREQFVQLWSVQDEDGVTRYPTFRLEEDKVAFIGGLPGFQVMQKIDWLKFACRWGLGGKLGHEIVEKTAYSQKLKKLNRFIGSEREQVERIVFDLQALSGGKPFDRIEVFHAYKYPGKRGVYSQYGKQVADVAYKLRNELSGEAVVDTFEARLTSVEKINNLKDKLRMAEYVERYIQGDQMPLRNHLKDMKHVDIRRICAGNRDPRFVVMPFVFTAEEREILVRNPDIYTESTGRQLTVVK